MFEDFLYEYYPWLFLALCLLALAGLCAFLLSIAKQERLANQVLWGKKDGLQLSGKTYMVDYVSNRDDRRILYVSVFGQRSVHEKLDIPVNHPSWDVVEDLTEGDRFTLVFNDHGSEWGSGTDLSMEAGDRYVLFRWA